LRHLSGAHEIAQVLHLREHIDLGTHTVIDPCFEAHEQMRDELGFVGAFYWRDVLIGTIRVVPMVHGLTLTEELLAQALPATAALPACGAHDWEVGRLVLAPEYRTNYEALRQCLWLSVTYLYQHARARALYASCSHALGRLYRRFGFSMLAQDVPLAGTSKSYTLIRSEPTRVIEALKPRAALN
jgi:predicted GNAT family N-acyltransferase